MNLRTQISKNIFVPSLIFGSGRWLHRVRKKKNSTMNKTSPHRKEAKILWNHEFSHEAEIVRKEEGNGRNSCDLDAGSWDQCDFETERRENDKLHRWKTFTSCRPALVLYWQRADFLSTDWETPPSLTGRVKHNMLLCTQSPSEQLHDFTGDSLLFSLQSIC